MWEMDSPITYNEDILPLETWHFSVSSLHTLSNFRLVLVDPGQVLCRSVIVFASHCRRITYKVAVAGLEGFIHGSANLARRRLPGAKPKLAVYVSTTSVWMGRFGFGTYGILAPVLSLTVLPL